MTQSVKFSVTSQWKCTHNDFSEMQNFQVANKSVGRLKRSLPLVYKACPTIVNVVLEDNGGTTHATKEWYPLPRKNKHHASDALEVLLLAAIEARHPIRTIGCSLLSTSIFYRIDFNESIRPSFATLKSLRLAIDGAHIYWEPGYDDWPYPTFAKSLRSASLLEELHLAIESRYDYHGLSKPYDLCCAVQDNIWPFFATISPRK